MKQFKIILGLILLASVTTFAQSPRIKLNQIIKDTVKGSVLISSPSDSGMVYSRDFYISYGVSDTVLILGGDTISGGGGLSSVLSDGVTITGNGTSGNELKVDTSLIATIKALNDSLATISASTTPDGVTITGDGSGGNPLKVDTLLISTIKGLVDTLTNRGYLEVSQLTDTLNANTRGYLTAEVDGSISNEGLLTVGAGTASTSVISSNTSGSTDVTLEAGTNVTLSENTGTNTITIASTGGGTSYNNITEDVDTVFIDDRLDIYNPNRTPQLTLSGPRARIFMINDNGSGDYSQLSFGESSTNYADMTWYNNDDKYQIFSYGDIEFSTQYVAPNVIPNLWIDADDGYVGINENDPQHRLDVVGTAGLSTGTAWTNTSDVRYKKIRDNLNTQDYLNKLLQLTPISFQWNELHQQKYESDLDKINYGFLAQEVESIYPSMVTTDKDGFKWYNPSGFEAILTGAIQEQQTIIEQQATEIETLKALITDLTNRLTILENK